MNGDEYRMYGKGRSGLDPDFSKGETWDPYWSLGRRERNESQFVAPSSTPTSHWNRPSTSSDSWPWSQKRSPAPTLTEKDIEGIAVFVGAILALAVVLWILAMIYVFRLEILTSVAGIGLAVVAWHLADYILVKPAVLRRWVAVSVATVATLAVLVVAALAVRDLLIFHDFNGNAFDLPPLPPGMLMRWVVDLLLMIGIVIVEGGLMFGLEYVCERPQKPQPPGAENGTNRWRGWFNRVWRLRGKPVLSGGNSEAVEQQKRAQQAQTQVQKAMRDARKYGIIYRESHDA